MGMYDEIRFRFGDVPDLLFQTKDTPEQALDLYEVREDGSLWHKKYDTEDRSDPNAEGLMRLAGMATRVNQCWVSCKLTGEIRFYTYTNPKDIRGSWIEYSAYLENGIVVRLNKLSGDAEGGQ